MHPAAIGPFKIERELGRGGMGEVYLARDTRLDRQVAIKALPAHLAQDPDRLARFQREAKVLASLNHPCIGAIYGLEEANGHQYLILEYVEGETLTDRLARGAIPVDEALNFAKQIAEALEVAHEKGIIHRDLKPGNVMVTGDDAIKVLDFGLARTEEGSASSIAAKSLADSPTVTSPARLNSPTIPGVILGTAGYMSPEQARGKPVDKRSDIFSFGCVLYEMLTGAMPFSGETVADAIGATLHKESDFGLLPAATARRVRDLLANCLAKDRKHRLHDIGDARLELERAILEPRDLSQINSAMLRPWWRSPGVLVTMSLLAVAVVVTALALKPTPDASPSERAVFRASLSLPEGMTLMENDRSIAVSPDGSQVVASLIPKDSASPPSLFLRDLSRLEFRAIPGTEEATYPFWSPDGRAIAFFAERKLKRIDLADGIVRVLCDAPAGRGGSWSNKGTIVFAPSAGGGLQIVSDAGGSPTPITSAATPSESHRLPQLLPDGERFLYFIQNSGVYAFDPGTKKSSLILPGPAEAIFVEPGFLLFARDENLMAQPFDPIRLTLSGSATPIAANVKYELGRAFINASASPQGTLVYQPVARLARHRLGWMDSQGVLTALPIEPFPLEYGSLSDDARRVAVAVAGDRGESAVAVIDVDRSITTNLIDPKAKFLYGAVISHDGQKVFTSAVVDGKQNLVFFPSAGGAPTLLLEGERGFEYGVGSIIPDGQSLLFAKVPLIDKIGDLMTIGLDTPQSPRMFLQTPDAEWSPNISPNGDVVAFVVGKTEGTNNILKVVAYPTPGAPVQAAPTPVGFGFGWMGPGELYWRDMSRRVWSASVSSKNGQIDIGTPKPLFGGRPLDEQTRLIAYDFAKERFLIAIEATPQEEPRVNVVSDWRPDAVRGQPRRE